MKKRVKIVAITPAYNEEKRIARVLSQVKKYVSQIIVIDDGSIDQTGQKSLGKKVIVLRHTINLGQGAALQTGFDYAKMIKADIVVTFDADGQFNAREIEKVVHPIMYGQADIVLGSRFLGRTHNMPSLRKFFLKAAILFTKVYSGLDLTDTHNGFRALNKKALQKISITQNRMSHASEIIHQIKTNNLAYKEIPVTVTYDRYSRSKGQKISNAFTIIYDLIIRKLFI